MLSGKYLKTSFKPLKSAFLRSNLVLGSTFLNFSETFISKTTGKWSDGRPVSLIWEPDSTYVMSSGEFVHTKSRILCDLVGEKHFVEKTILSSFFLLNMYLYM